MLRAAAWPYSVFDSVESRLSQAKFGEVMLDIAATAKGYIISGSQLRDRSHGVITLQIEITTPPHEVASAVFGSNPVPRMLCGVRVLCKESKFRSFTKAANGQTVTLEIPLQKLRAVAEINPFFVCDEDGISSNGTAIERGSILGVASKPVFLTVDEDWTGETIPVDWLDFAAKQLPKEAFLHVELSGGSQVPKVWLNKKYEDQLQHILTRKGDASPAGLAGAALRELIWSQVWEKVVVWAVKEESAEHPEWPSSRIAKFWRTEFERHGFDLVIEDPIETGALNEVGLRIQHCLRTAQNLTRIQEILRFQPESGS
jgi:hypothetical protein